MRVVRSEELASLSSRVPGFRVRRRRGDAAEAIRQIFTPATPLPGPQ